MGQRSKVETLPASLKSWLDAQLVARGFSDYEQLAADLRARGAEVSKSGLHRYGSKYELRIAQLKSSAEQARALVEASPDDEGAMSEALIRLTQNKLFDVLVDMEVDPESIELPKLAKAIADISRSAVTQKRWASEAKAQARRELLEEQRKALEAMPNKGGVTAETKTAIREALGIV